MADKTVEKEKIKDSKAGDILQEEYEKDLEDDDTIRWEAPEHEFIEKTALWFWASLVIALLLVAFALWTKNFLFAVFIVIAELIVLNYGSEEPKIWSFYINDEGIGIGRRKIIRFKDIVSYDIHPSSDDFSDLVIKTNRRMNPIEKILIHTEDSEIIEEELSRHLKKEDIPVGLIEIMERIVGF